MDQVNTAAATVSSHPVTEHSPLPWYLFQEGKDPAPGIEAADDMSVVVWGEGGRDDAGVQGETPEQAKANASFIVKAVNAHEALVKALQDTLCELTACASQLAVRGLKGHPDDSVSRAQLAARAALALAKGE